MIRILLLVVLILINGIFSATEIAFLSINKYKLAKEVKKNNKKAKKIVNLLGNTSSFLSAIQIAITLSGFLASAFAAESFAQELASIIVIDFISEETLTTILVVLITCVLSYFTLVFGELVPKKIGLAKADKIAYRMVGVINVILVVFKPVIKLLQVSTDIVTKLIGIKQKKANQEEDIKNSIIDSGLEDFEKQILLNVFEFNDSKVRDVMTPKEEVIFLDLNDSPALLRDKIVKHKYTRYPVVENEKVIGILNVKDIIVNNKKTFDLKSYVRRVGTLDSEMIIDDAFMYLNSVYEPFAVVVENKEYVGIVTIEDIIENVIGEVFDEYDKNK
ncbi:MAG: DUF21 domain-containing protein [Bacilli bacterium]|nr:DUF21 domain-containing protein [Bacilli bacterium]